ncbi:MAG: DUF4847 family protein [Phocaeicola sp.]
MKLKSLLYLLLTLPFLCGCNNEDDLEAIFQSGTWNVANLFTTTNWKDDNKGTEIYTDGSQVETFNKMAILFQADGNITGTLSNNVTLKGTWSADASKRTITINISNTVTYTGLNKIVVDQLKETKHYRGDSNFLRLANAAQNKFIQLAHY